MTAICVDDERLLMEDTVSMCQDLPGIRQVKGFICSQDALDWLEHHDVQLALLDIDLPDMNGIALAAAIKAKWPDTAILFLTGYAQYAVDAFAVRACGYLLKPVTRERLAADVAYALSVQRQMPADHVMVRTFGNFDVFVDGTPISFRRTKCKELLAYLVDKHGTGVSRAELSSVLWEGRTHDRRMQKQLDVYIRSLRDTLREYGIEEMLELQRGQCRVRPECFSCDAYRFFNGDSVAINSFRGEYMSAYSWASMTESMMYWKIMDNR